MTRTLIPRQRSSPARERRLTLLIALAFGVTSLGGLAIPRSALGWDDDTFGPGSEALLITMQNQARASVGRMSLGEDDALRTIARWRSRDMVERGYFSHTIKGTDRKVFWHMEHTYDYCFTVAGENIGTMTWAGASEEDATNWVFAQFMDSPGHRANIIGGAWDAVAVGAYKTTGDTYVWTVLFADRCADATAAATP